jgi:hypothetical protein
MIVQAVDSVDSRGSWKKLAIVWIAMHVWRIEDDLLLVFLR